MLRGAKNKMNDKPDLEQVQLQLFHHYKVLILVMPLVFKILY